MSTPSQYQQYPHTPRNINLIHAIEKRSSGVNMRIAVGITNVCQSMTTFWLVLFGMAFWMLINSGTVRLDPPPWQFLLTIGSLVQLPLMMVIMIGQAMLGRHQELMASEQYQTTQKTYADIEQIIQHLQAQDEHAIQLALSIEQLQATLKEEKTQPLIQEGAQA